MGPLNGKIKREGEGERKDIGESGNSKNKVRDGEKEIKTGKNKKGKKNKKINVHERDANSFKNRNSVVFTREGERDSEREEEGKYGRAITTQKQKLPSWIVIFFSFLLCFTNDAPDFFFQAIQMLTDQGRRKS